jgi:hypothetical protein
MENNKAFRNLIFTATDAASDLPETCSCIHFETSRDTAAGLKESHDREIIPVTSKVLWCTDARSGHVVDWMSASEKCRTNKKMLKHSSSVYSSLYKMCARVRHFIPEKEILQLPLRLGLDDTIQVNPKYRQVYEAFSPEMELIGYKASFEAEYFSNLPRTLKTASTSTKEALAVTKKNTSDWSHICSVNETWSELTGYFHFI